MSLNMDYSKFIKFYPDFPIKGVNFADIIPFLQDKTRFLLQFSENGMDTGIFCLPVLFVDTVTISCLGDKDVGLRKRYWRLYNPVVRTSNVTCISYFCHLAVFFDSDVYYSTTEHVTAICETYSYAFVNLVILVVWHRNENLHALLGIHVGINRIHPRKSLLEKFAASCGESNYSKRTGFFKKHRKNG